MREPQPLPFPPPQAGEGQGGAGRVKGETLALRKGRKNKEGRFDSASWMPGTSPGMTSSLNFNSWRYGRARPGHPRCAEHVQQLGGASPLSILMAEKD